MPTQPDYDKLLTPISDVTTSIEALLEGAFGSLMGDQREELKRIYSTAWGLHTLFMDIITSLGIENIAQRAYLRHKFDEFTNTLRETSQSLLNGTDGKLNEEQTVSVAYINDVSQLLSNYVDKLWWHSRIQHDQLALDKTNITIDDAINPADLPLTEKPIDLEYLLTEDLPPLYTNHDAFRFCVHEVLQNAIKFTAVGYVQILPKVIDNAFVVRIEDSGHGMDSYVMQRATEQFYMADPRHEGIGLGLTVVYALMQALGGEIEIESEVDVGTTVMLHFPLHSSTE